MKRLNIYIDETYNLQSENQFFCIAGFMTFEPEIIISEYKKILRRANCIKYEVKSTDKDSEKIRSKIIKNEYILKKINCFSILQMKNEMSFEYFRENVFEQETVFYHTLITILLTEIIEKFKEELEISIIVEIDKNDKIKKEFYLNLEGKLRANYEIKSLDVEILHSNKSLGLQFADQITGICREQIKNGRYSEFIEKFKVLLQNPLAKK